MLCSLNKTSFFMYQLAPKINYLGNIQKLKINVRNVGYNGLAKEFRSGEAISDAVKKPMAP